MLQLTFNPGLTLIGFRTTRPWVHWHLLEWFLANHVVNHSLTSMWPVVGYAFAFFDVNFPSISSSFSSTILLQQNNQFFDSYGGDM